MTSRGTPPNRAALLILAAALASACAAHRPADAKAPRETTYAKLERAYGLMQAEKPEEAAALLEEIRLADPKNRQARLELAYLRIRAKRWRQAVDLLTGLLDEEPGDARLRLELGYARQALGDRAAAGDEFELAGREPGEFQEQALEALKANEVSLSTAAIGVTVDSLLNGGYDDLKRGDVKAAREKFRLALRADPGKVEVAKQLGYMDAADGDLASAALDFAGASRLAPQDHRTALELGYIYDSLHQEAAAEKAFAAAAKTRDPETRADAERALKSIRARTGPFYLDVDGQAWYTTRFKNRIASVDALAGWRPSADGPWSLYVAARWTQDSRSHGGDAGDIFSDNALSVGPGVRWQPRGWNASVTAEIARSQNLIRGPERPDKSQTDGRVVAADYRYWSGPRNTFFDANGSLGWYGRYRDDFIGYLQLRAGVKAWDGARSQVSLYAPVYGLRDTNRDYYNNVVEYGGGVEVQPWTRLNLKFRAERLFGVYMGVQGRDPNPYGPRYADTRVIVVFSLHLAKARKPPEFEPMRRTRFLW